MSLNKTHILLGSITVNNTYKGIHCLSSFENYINFFKILLYFGITISITNNDMNLIAVIQL